jgi:hypothetical protein
LPSIGKGPDFRKVRNLEKSASFEQIVQFGEKVPDLREVPVRRKAPDFYKSAHF